MEAAPAAALHVAGPPDPDGRQRCLGCDHLLRERPSYFRLGRLVAERLRSNGDTVFRATDNQLEGRPCWRRR